MKHRRYATDYHVHTLYSDGKASPEEYVDQAIKAGLNELGFSEHLALFKENQSWCLDPDDVPKYFEHIGRLAEKTNAVAIKKGLEVDYFRGKEKEIMEFLDRFDLDYRIGSVHFMGDATVDNGPEFYFGKNIDTLYEEYFEYVNDAASSGIFDIIGHCDLVRIYGHKPSYDPYNLYRKLARTFRKYDVVFELNTNGRNRPVADFYPDRRFLHIFSEEKVAVCVNSDAHMPSRIGQYFDEAYELLRSAGFTEMAVFNKRKREMIPL